MRRILPVLGISFFLLLFVSELLLSGCATRSTPSGGPRDTTAPKVDTSFPASGTVLYQGTELRIIFDEYISLKSPTQQINFSPPLKNTPDFTLKGRELIIEWDDTLQANTTYTISFGEAISDFTEGNINDRLKFVFSTGSYLDSLKLIGRVTDSRKGIPEKGILVALYDQDEIDANDSVPFSQIPSYYTYTNDEGDFDLENLRYGSFHVIAFEDKRGNFLINTGAEKMGFLKETVVMSDSTSSLRIKTFQPLEQNRFYGASHIAHGQIQLAFNYSPDSLSVFELSADSATKQSYLTWEIDKDTSTYWFDQGKRDSIVLIIKNGEVAIDTPVVYLRPFKTKKVNVTPLASEVAFNQDFQFVVDRPIDTFNIEMIKVLTSKDTLNPKSVFLVDSRTLSIKPVKRPAELTFQFLEGAVTAFDGNTNDSLIHKTTNLRKNELGSVIFGVNTNYEGSLVLLIMNDGGKVIQTHPFVRSLKIEFKNQKPGIYKAEIIVDIDNNGEWTTGEYLTRRSSENIVKYLENIDVRANWDLELLWEAEITDP